MNKSKNFLHVHSMYSIGDSTATPDAIVKRAKELGCENITLTDHGMLLGIEPFMDAGKKYEVNTIPGVEAYLADRTHFILIARNYKGYQSICYAMRDANTQIENVGALTYPIMSDDILEKYFKDNPNVIATTACVAGPIGKIMTSSRRAQRKLDKTRSEIKTLTPQCNLYLKVKERLDETTEIIKNIKKERTANNKFNNKAFLARMNKLKEKLSLLDIEDKNYQKIANQLLEKTEQNNLAKEKLAEIDKKLKTLEPEKKQLKEQADQLKKTYTKYLKLKEKVDSTPEIPAVILYKKALDRMIYLKSIFKNLFIELQYHGIEDEAFNAEYLIKIASELKLPLIAANDAHMVDNSEESIEARRLVRFNYFKKSQTVEDSDKELYLKSDDKLRASLLRIYDEEIVNKAMSNLNILSYCKVEFPDEKHYPKVSSDVNFDNLLEERRQEMISNGEWNDDYQKRLDHEVKIIKQMGYVDYHLVVRDFCIEGRKLGVIPKSERINMPEDFNEVEKWIKTKGYKEGVGIGPGRGSAAGSLVCYLLGITNIDPIKYDLLFERYLNPSRVSMPDIDTDVATSLRPFVIKYLKWKYGHRAVCSIATETTYAARAAVQMAGRERASQLYDHEPKSTATLHKSEYNRVHVYPLSDAVPDTPKIKLNDCIDDLKAKFGHDKEAMLVLNHALLLEGVVSGTGVHAGGVVISDNDNINEYLPLAWNEEKQVWTAQCDMVKVEERGLLKMDLLGLNTLDCINDCLYLIKKTKGISIDINKISFEPDVFKKIYASGLTNSVFQFESQGMKSMLRDFKPTCFEDLILLVACYRPGPMQCAKRS